MRSLFWYSFIILFLAIGATSYFHQGALWLLLIVVPLFSLGIYDISQNTHAILRNFPLLGHFRYLSELISPEIRQYFSEGNTEGRPFTRLQRNYVYKRAKLKLETHPFGTELNVYDAGYYWMAHSMYPRNELKEEPRIKIGGSACTKPYHASILNISAMSFGSLGKNAVMALNKGAKEGNFYQNTGEGGLSDYHLSHKADLVWQIGTAYFGCRDEKGNFSEKFFIEQSIIPEVKMIEVKISQGAKPGLGGVLPASKNTPEIARIRRLTPHKLVHSPPSHHTFDDAEGMLYFIDRLRKLSGGKPTGFKLCVGSRKEFTDICEAMLSTGILPDFITVDGGEGGTGAAPIEFSDNVGMPLDEGLIFVVDTLRGFGLRRDIRVIASCKIITGFDIVKRLAMGADMCNSARGMMFALGCIQALKCDSNECPAGITTHKPQLMNGVHIGEKGTRVLNYHKETVKSALAMLSAAGLDSLAKLNRSFIYKRVDQQNTLTLEQLYPSVEEGSYLSGDSNPQGEPGRHPADNAGNNSKQKVQGKGRDYPNNAATDKK